MNDENTNFESLRQAQLQNDAALAIEQATVERLLDKGQQIHVQSASPDAVATAIHQLESDGFRVGHDDGDTAISGYASVDFYNDMINTRDYYKPSNTDEIDTEEVYGVPIRLATSLPDATLLIVHDEALAPSLVTSSVVPFLVRHSDGIVIACAEE